MHMLSRHVISIQDRLKLISPVFMAIGGRMGMRKTEPGAMDDVPEIVTRLRRSPSRGLGCLCSAV
jgi:hypothetical protein